MSEIGPKGFKKFDTAKQFTSWLRLAPNNRISGGRILSNRISKERNRLKIAFRQAANAIEFKGHALIKLFQQGGL
jgi:transposase